MSDKIWFDPTSDKWVLSDGEHYLEVPYWAREIIADEFERETRQLKAENAKLRELVDGFTWCCGHHCGQECPLYDVSEPDYCREASIKRDLGVEVDE